ncbi:MAG: 50S ribosomal protein L5 [Candidatus Bathyarchaeota archaeon]|nr:MAG: 50S ribosomal protein L5 [Candidatus Bathyarchaeota archaeon]
MADEKQTPETVATEEETKAPATETEAKEKKAVKSNAKVAKKTVTKKTPESKAEPASAKKEKAVKEEKPVKEETVSELEAPVEAESVVDEKPAPKVVAKPVRKEWAGNPMLIPVIEKVTVNMSVGKSGAPLEQAVTIIKQLTNQKPSKRNARKTIREFGIRKGEPIACVVTLREESAKMFLVKALYAVEKKLSKYAFDNQGNFSFGIKEHINIPGIKYLPELGIHGMDVSVSLGRAGYRVKRRHRRQAKVGKDHQLTAEEAILFIKDEFDVEIQ